MQALNKILAVSVGICLLLGLVACKKEVIEKVNYENTIFELDTVNLYENNLNKNKQKSGAQYISVLYSDLFSTTISSADLNDLSILFTAQGDKQMATELLLSSYMNVPNVIIPTEQAMRQDIEKFVEETYIRFLLRKPTAYEKEYLTNLIEEDQGMSPELVYMGVVLSNEYQFY